MQKRINIALGSTSSVVRASLDDDERVHTGASGGWAQPMQGRGPQGGLWGHSSKDDEVIKRGIQ